jgi:hypothetical protein
MASLRAAMPAAFWAHTAVAETARAATIAMTRSIGFLLVQAFLGHKHAVAPRSFRLARRFMREVSLSH